MRNMERNPIRVGPWTGQPIYEENEHITALKKNMEKIRNERGKENRKNRKNVNHRTKCYLKIYEWNGSSFGDNLYSCKEVREFKEVWKIQFRRQNKSDSVKDDPRYKEYCEEIEQFLSNCYCEK